MLMKLLKNITLGSPPLARGTGNAGTMHGGTSRITPACAGNSATVAVARAMHGDHPRLRGEQIPGYPFLHAATGSPPLARGTGEIKAAMLTLTGITPACAGNSYTSNINPHLGQDHPRLRGEQRYIPLCPRRRGGSPPLARGTAEALIPFSEALRITPACAGNRIFSIALRPAAQDHPRLRGEQERDIAELRSPLGSPPLARGTASAFFVSTTVFGITPACAGNSSFDR